MKQYNHKKIEKKWQKRWEEEKIYKSDDTSDKRKFYTLVEFPYPSGNLHVGHWYAFAMPDIFVRQKRMQGFNIFFPIGFDAFGLPAENAAIKRGINPRKWTYSNIDYMRGQLRTMGASYDWSREVVTCDPDYYQWTQWLFLQLFKNNLVYQKETNVNWCKKCKTVLANEQVLVGKCERCESDVIKKEMKQWSIRITDYADRLIDDLDELDWPESIKESQKNWIGRSEGAEIEFNIKDSEHKIKVFTTRPDTLFGVTYMVIAPEHELLKKLKSKIKNWGEVQDYIDSSKKKTEIERTTEDKDKTGVRLKGVKAINPANKEEIPVFIADYVLVDYGTGAIMAVPAHDERDYSFAKKFDLQITEVISQDGTSHNLIEAYTGEGKLINSGRFNALDALSDGGRAITDSVGGRMTNTYRLRDWTVSRQRYWGAPIPIIHCKRCGEVAVPDKDLPVELPEIDDYLPRDDGKSPLSKVEEWVNVRCPECGDDAERETDTLDTFVDSSWYYLRYTDSKNGNEFASRKNMDKWMPIDLYSGGSEHTTMHLLYSRFFHKALHDLGLVNNKEPYLRRMNRGLILGPDGNKMSKSKGNGIDPDEIVDRLGADTVRMYLAFIGPYNEARSYPWNPDGVVGVRRFLEKIWRIQDKITDDKPEKDDDKIRRLLHQTIKKVGEDIEDLKFNTAIAQIMILVNAMEKENKLRITDYKLLIIILSPFAPHITEELWRGLFGNKQSIHLEKWPKYSPELIKEDTFELVVQINGKIKGKIMVPADLSEDKMREMAINHMRIKEMLDGETPKKVIVVPGRLVNIVI